MIEIYKASAGSGKTETLTRKYLDLLLESGAGDREAYRHILAVTFTNKATDEMKERVLRRLYELSLEDSEKGGRAKSVLITLLHDYSAFSITTIDRFFQIVTRSFAREIGQYASYRVEIDDKAILTEAVDNLFDSLDKPENKSILDWLVKCALSQLELNGTNNIENELLKMAGLFLNEDFRIKKLKALEDGRFYTDAETIEKLENGLRKSVKEYENTVISLAESILKTVSDAGLTPEDFRYGDIGVVKKYINKDFSKAPSNRFFQLLDGPDYWFSKNKYKEFKAKGELARSYGLQEKLSSIRDMFGNPFKTYHTNKFILKNLYIFGLFNEIYRSIYQVLKERNMMLLSETTEAIHRIIDGSDVPFIYEKIGNRFDHYMLDEFQDTSVLQWGNFVPLLKDSLASDNYNMIVGDVKQSIYRWRGSDWSTLDSGINEQFREDQLSYPKLEDNYRSGSNIVEFNGDFFTSVTLDAKITEIYKGAKQKSHKPFDGYINVNFVEGRSREFWQKSLAMLREQVDRLTKELHYPLSSIAVLTRSNAEAKMVAENLIAYGYDVISEDSLTLSSSFSVTAAVAVLKSLLYPDDAHNAVILSQLDIDIASLNLDFSAEEGSLYNLCESILRKVFPEPLQGEIVYVNAFLDSVLDYQNSYGSDIAGFLDWWKESGINKTVALPDMAEAIQVFTIHKSKGLEMDVVILPFFKMPLSHASRSDVYLWGTPPDNLSQMGIVPLKFSGIMENTFFNKEYAQEVLYTQIDAINTAYVAMTRPKVELIINAPLPKDGGNNKDKGVSDLLYNYLLSNYSDYKTKGESFEIGEEIDYADYIRNSSSGKTGSDGSKEQVKITSNASFPIHGESGRLKMAYRADGFFEDSNRIKGIVLHDIMSAVYTPEDLPTAVSAAVREGKLPEADSARVLQNLSLRIGSHPEWFDGSMQVLNELTIVATDGSAERPDRVLIDGDRAVVIDYKFGGEDAKYRFQVLRYMRSLGKMGYRDVKGYIWYLEDNKTVNVE